MLTNLRSQKRKENKMKTMLELLKESRKLVKLIRHYFPAKVHAPMIPHRRGFYQRKEDKEVMNTLRRLCKNDNFSRVKTLILHGPAGHGKVPCAANLMDHLYTKPVRSRFFWNKVWNYRNRPTILGTVKATNKATMFESFCRLAKEIGLTEQAKAANQELSLLSRTSEGRQYHINLQNQCQENAYDKPLKQIYEEVMNTLRCQGSWVLLIEGVEEDRLSHQQFWPSPGDASFGNGLVIMTTTDSKLFQEEGDDYPLAKVFIGKMTKKDAVRFLAKKSGIPVAVAERFANLARCIPQDIAKLGAFMREYKEETNKQLTFGNLPPPPEDDTFPQYMIMMMELTRENQTQLLKFLACCSSENYLPLEILERGIAGPLEEANFRKFVDLSEREEIKVVTIHPRDLAMLRDILSGQRQNDTEKTWTYVLNFVFQKKKGNINAPTLSCLDVSHVIKCLSDVCKDALHYNRDKDFKLLRLVLPHLEEAVKLRDKLKLEGEFDPIVLANGHACLGEGLLINGRPGEARENLNIALDLFKNYEGAENVQLDLANVCHFLGEAHSNSHLASPWEGVIYLDIALEMKEGFYKAEDHPQIALTLRSLGNVLNELGRHTEAINFIERALKIYDGKENFKQEYGFTLSALGSSYRYLGRYADAEHYLKKALKIFESVESPSELRIGVTLSRLASVHRNMDKLGESIASLEMALKKFGYNDIYSAVILSKLSVVYCYKGDFEKSVELADKAKKISDERYGTKSHPAKATTLLNFGHAQSDVGDVEDAVNHLKVALDINKAIRGNNHPIVATNYNYLSYGYLQMGKFQQAKEELQNARQVMDNYSRSHPEVANTLKRLSKVCLILGEAVESAEVANRALQIYKETYADTVEHREVRRGAVRVAYACSKLGLFDMAEEYLKEVELGFPTRHESRLHPEFAVFLRKKTEITLDRYEFQWSLNEVDAEEILSKGNEDLLEAERILSDTFQFKRQIASIKKEKARLSMLMRNYRNAYEDVRSALDSLPRNCDYLKADFLLIRSDAEKGLNLVNKSKVSLETAENIYRNIFGDDHPMVAVTLQKQCSLSLYVAHKSDKGKNEAHKYHEASHQVCEVLKSNLEQQLTDIQTDFLRNYSFDQHPILKRQQSLHRRLTRNQGAW
ncbi:uncharacterized protein LOC111334317 [Stylophora pistillata]|uniref:Nephrocystin-3 n=1 Tax=Stylophora pistillata TaxID=50429 RepID=A0A2B4S036_STYPI|nr:uncharacterized protein LOC111334317 [Stylophora pistillata]PFX22383.1 Nephrocystin-3 [Stylophora pistillata]